jgi:exosortase J
MSTTRTAITDTPLSTSRTTQGLPLQATLVTVLAVAGVFSILPTVAALWALWNTDQLKSIGGLVPLLSLVLILRVWRSLDWEMDGTWWGLVLLVATIALVHVRERAILELVIGPSWSIFLPPHSLVAFCYTAGIVLLFGGKRLFRAALFPIVLTWFVNPVPNFFTLHVDLPLQHVSSLIARGFAHAMGQKLTPDQLRLMFTPDFGMFIAPGCNGIRGAITMGFIALVAGYLYKFKARVWAAVVIAAVLLGYVFNLVRLCCLVLYYLVALHIPWLQTRAEMGDYVIGACLFFVATALLFMLIQRLSPNGDLRPPRLAQVVSSAGGKRPGGSRSFELRWAALAVVLLLGSASYARERLDAARHPRPATDPKALGQFPQHVGKYHLVREWNEYLTVGGPLIFYWADYAVDVPDAASKASGEVLSAADQAGVPNMAGNDDAVVSVGISPVLGAHDTLICHSARGEDWLWHGNLAFGTAASQENFSGSFFNDGAEQYMEATTICSGTSCGQYANERRHFGLIYSRPDTQTFLALSPTRPIPVLLRTSTSDTAMASDLARMELTANLRNFLAGADLSVFTKPYRE